MLGRLGGLVAIVVMSLMTPGVGAQASNRAALVGTWKAVSYELEFQDTGERSFPFGSHPNGYLVFTAEGRMIGYLEAEGRTAPRTDQDRAAAYRTIVAYTGKYRVQGNKWITKVDGSWNVEWVGTEQARTFDLNGDTLKVISQWNPHPAFNRRMVRGYNTFEREK
jgi:Lipocalin-like domain